MKKLFVMRHAKSSWNNPQQADFDRPLNARGLRAALEIGEFLQRQNVAPDLIVASPAVRTQQTAELVKDAANFRAEIELEPEVYEATVGVLSELVQNLPPNCNVVLLVGHNPGCEDLIRDLTGETREMPTAAVAEIEFEVTNWQETLNSIGKLVNLFKPKEIAD